eukprot:5071658-Pleurochrysis_carterae.AAC.1
MMMKMRVDGVKVLYEMEASILVGESDTDMAELSGQTIREYIAMCYNELVTSAAAFGEQLATRRGAGKRSTAASGSRSDDEFEDFVKDLAPAQRA